MREVAATVNVSSPDRLASHRLPDRLRAPSLVPPIHVQHPIEPLTRETGEIDSIDLLQHVLQFVSDELHIRVGPARLDLDDDGQAVGVPRQM
jgi:hypothetical protein